MHLFVARAARQEFIDRRLDLAAVASNPASNSLDTVVLGPDLHHHFSHAFPISSRARHLRLHSAPPPSRVELLSVVVAPD